ncbi:MAG: ABC transporter ATP-binding protein [Actinomycetia bacterium]|nr:ABC transporter ATP-binding protein [Actinomycetes bacterium]MCP4228058.1 ABC transporter ATP-binding protein [Actinomycetes bacterium]MCP5033288.1 ABC transporter ATP-binding protein [Actinomycetes bacterium]
MNNQSWLATLIHELEARGLALTTRTEIVVEIEDFLTESDEAALDHFGPPADYASELVSVLTAQTHQPSPRRPSSTPIVTATAVSKRYRNHQVLDKTSFTASGGEIVALMGSNGVGKSTLLRILAGLEPADSGHVELKGAVGYVPQAGGVDPYLRPTEHFELFGAAARVSRAAARTEGLRLATELGWDAASAPIVLELSGGTRQKLMVITALVAKPDVLLLDEPYQGMDADGARRFWELLWAWSEHGGAAVVSSHSDDVLHRAHTVLELEVAQ